MSIPQNHGPTRKLSLVDWIEANPETVYDTDLRHLPRAVEVRSNAPDLWHLHDYEVVLPLAGQGVLMLPRRDRV